MLFSSLAAGPAMSQSLDRTMPKLTTDSVLTKQKAKAKTGTAVKLNPSNRFNVTPQEVYNRLKNEHSFTNSINKARAHKKDMARIAAPMNVADSLILYGLNHSDGTWETLSGLDSKVYSFQAAPVVNYMAASTADITNAMAAFYAKGKFYILRSDMDDDGMTTSSITTYDADTWQELGTTMLTENDPTMDMYFRQVATYDPVTDKAYTVSWGNGKPLISIDLNTMETKSIGQVNKFIQTLFTDKDGQLYGIGYNDMILYKIDKTTGAPTEVGKVDPPFNLSADPMSAVCDPATGRIYWVAVDGGGKESALFTIDPATAHVEKITDLPGNEHFLGLYVPYTEAGAPAAPSGIGYANGKLTFTAPSKTYTTGEELSGGLTAFVTVDNGNAIEKSVSPGENVSLDLGMADGSHVITIALSNAAGMSPERRLNTFVGQDVPSAVTGLTLAIDDGETADLTWNAPTTSMNNGPVDDASINYKVVRYPDETVVAEGLKDTHFSESVPEAHASYYYTVTAFSGDRVGGMATSNKVTAGSTWFPPYIEHFDTQADFDSFKVIDANNDGATWSLMLPYGDESGYAYLMGNGTADVDTGIYYGDGNDDYLISPQISLKKGAEYRLTFETSPDQWMTLEHMTVLLGGKKDVTGDERVLASLDLPYDKNFYDIRFSVEEDGMYYLLFHGDSPAESVNVGMDNISIDVYSTFLGPDCVTDVKVEAGEKGALSNTLTFTTPTKKYNGDTLDEISYINVYRNGSNKPAHVFESPKTGETLTWTDTDVEQGNVAYRIVPFNADGQGEEAIINNWVGLDMPANVTNLTVKMNADNKAVLTWDKATDKGMHGGYVNPDDVQYVLCRYNEYNWTDHWEQVTDYTKELTLTDETFSPLYGAQQQYVDYLLVAVNGAGASEGTGTGIVLGEPYERPYTESFAGGYASKDPWTLSASSYNYAWNMVTGSGISVKPYDGDEGMLQFSLLDDDSNNQVLMGPRISLDGSEAPEISFFMYHGFEAEEGDLTLKIYTNYDDEGWENTANVDYNNGSYGWSRYSLPLRSDADNVQIAFGAYAADASASIYLDDLKIDESKENDLAIESITIDKKRIEAGESTNVNVGVANYGTKDAEGYNVVLTRNGETIATKSGEKLTQNATTQVSFELSTTKADAGASYTYSATLEYEPDLDTENNSSSSVSLYVHGSNLPAAENLTGTASDNSVTLEWDKPAKSEITDDVTDGFDEYESFIIDGIGDWKTYDGDGTQTVYFSGPMVANAFDPKAWQVWAPEEAGFSLDKFDVLVPHSGDKYLACWAASDGIYTTLPNDDWLISSEVTGGTDVSFYYRMPNEGSDPQVFEMMYSTTDQEPESFTAFDRDSIATGTDWVLFEYTLPADAKYFAIRSCSKGSYTVALLDDITYTPLYGSTTTLTLTGYNVYRDNQLIASNVPGETYTDTEAGEGSHTYNVTAVWKEGESNYSNGYECTIATGISGTTAQDGVHVGTTRNAIVVSGAAGKPVEVYTLTGQQLFDETSDTDVTTISMQTGVYIVTVDNKTFKVVVK